MAADIDDAAVLPAALPVAVNHKTGGATPTAATPTTAPTVAPSTDPKDLVTHSGNISHFTNVIVEHAED